jgi:signal transduction histidine kinase
MKPPSSLTNRIFLASSALAVLSVAVAVFVTTVQVTSQAEAELARGLQEAGTLVEQYRATLVHNFIRQATLVADLPRLKAAVALDDRPTMQPIAEEYRKQMRCDRLIITNERGGLLADAGSATGSGGPPADLPAIRHAIQGRPSTSFLPHAGGVLQLVAVPIWIGPDQPEILGALGVAFNMDRELAGRFKELTDSEIAFVVDGRVPASTLQGLEPVLPLLPPGGGIARVTVGDNEYVAISRVLAGGTFPALGADPGSFSTELISDAEHVPVALVLRSRTERLRFLRSLHTALAATALLAVLAAVILSYAVARTVTRPLGAITAAMREMTATGDLTRRIELPSNARWDDEDARLLASTFNTMTESIARFQREAAQRERLSSLGRLSTVIAHEIRNPLMIIKTALRRLRRAESLPPDAAAAIADIDGEVGRLNRIVSEVLDFARPIRFDYGPADLNALCVDAAGAAGAGEGAPAIRLALDRSLPVVTTDAERLRLALVNILTNARHAVEAAAGDGGAPGREEPGEIVLSTALQPDGRFAIEVRDTGIGIGVADLSRVFDPYFTTKRTGTGLGLAIARNIVEGLGGTIAIRSRERLGTEIRLELPLVAAPARSTRQAAVS